MSDADIKHSAIPATLSADFTHTTLKSSFDASQQPIRYWAAPAKNRPVLIFLHSWSADLNMNPGAWFSQAVQRGWSFVMPNFRGPNNTPEACASPAAIQDVIDATDFALDSLHADPARVYVAGGSGGAHMTMVMAAAHPHRFTAAAEYCGISDLTAWYNHHARDGIVKNYAQMIALSVGGAPGSSKEVDAQLRARSPLFHIQNAKDLPIDFCHGILDGQTGSVPFRHSVDAFNVIARAHNAPEVTEDEIQEAWDHHHLLKPSEEDVAYDPEFETRAIHVRRHAGPSRLTLFQGGHDGLPHAGCQWLARFTKQTTR
jgi:pimeloyl-ACP methyl ester carboxylesterase